MNSQISRTVAINESEPNLKWTLVDLTGTNDPATGDIYSGLDRFGRMKECRWYDAGSSGDAVRLKYGYDRNGNRLWREDLVAKAGGKDFDEYSTFDGLNRLQSFSRGLLNSTKTGLMAENFASCWNLDSTGNWSGMKQASSGGLWDLEQSRSANTANEIAAIHNSFGTSWANPGYDAAGNMTTIPQPLSMGDTFAATWDAWNRLVKLVEDSNIVAEYGYDASRRRIIKKRYTGGTFIETQHVYLSTKWQTLEVRLDAGVSADQQYIWGLRYIDDLVVRDRTVTDPLDERIYAMQEVQWNVIALADAVGDVVQRFAYHPYGKSQVLTSTFTSSSDSYHWQYRFTSREHDLDTGLDYFRNRYWHNMVGAFITRDPLEYVDGASLYAGYFVPGGMDAWGLSPKLPPPPWLPEREYDPGWDWDQWKNWEREGNLLPGHHPSMWPDNFPKEHLGKLQKRGPILWGQEVEDSTFPAPSEIQIKTPTQMQNENDKSIKCRCEKPTMKENLARPQGDNNEFPVPGLVDVKCTQGKVVAMRYPGRCVPNCGQEFPKETGSCCNNACSLYIKWKCIDRNFDHKGRRKKGTEGNPPDTIWVPADNKMLTATKCKPNS